MSSKNALASSLGSAKFRDLGARAILPQGERILLFKSTALTGDALVKSALLNANVAAASLNYRRYADAVTPNDPGFTDLWGLNNTGQTGGTAGADISAPEAWSTTTGSSGVVVADIDTGVAYDHVDLAANMWHNPGEIPGNGIDDDGNGYVDDVYGIDAVNGDSNPYDDQGHGTHTSGTAAAVGNNGIGITGVAWQARVMALKFLGPDGGSDAGAITCINYVVNEKLNHGVNVVAINASWGGGGYDGLLRNAINAAGAANIIFCAAAGNGGPDRIGNGDDNDAQPSYPSSYDGANIISVAATDSTDALASFSNYGATSVDLAAPGVGILSTWPGDGYASSNGTSMATPHVTGAVALCAAQFPSETMAQRVRRILDHVDPLASLSGMMTTGGRLDLAAAVNAGVPVPTVTGFTPASGPVGIAVTLTGSGLTGATKVAFHGTDATTFTVVSGTQITVTVPAGATSGSVAVTTSGGTAASVTSFTVTVLPPAPTVTGFTPASGPVATAVTLTGSGLTGATKVAFHGTSAASFNAVSPTQIMATVPAVATSGAITVTTPGGTGTSATSFTVVVRPKVTLKLSGLKSGAMRLGKRVTAKGKVTPTSLARSKVTLTARLKKGAKWIKVKSMARTISASGAYSWKYKPAKKGAYRMRAAIAKTAAHAAAKTKWRPFRVK